MGHFEVRACKCVVGLRKFSNRVVGLKLEVGGVAQELVHVFAPDIGVRDKGWLKW